MMHTSHNSLVCSSDLLAEEKLCYFFVVSFYLRVQMILVDVVGISAANMLNQGVIFRNLR